MLRFPHSKQKISVMLFAALFGSLTGQSQNKTPDVTARPKPVWWFGASGAANFNTYRGTTQMLNNSFSTPTAFHKGYGVKPYASLLTEYRPNDVLGGMLNIGFDNRGGKFDAVMAPCDCEANLSTNISYVTIEPSLRLAPFASKFYVFAGPTIGFNVRKSFRYTQEKQEDRRADWSDVRKTVFSAQAGAGIDIPVSSRSNRTQVTISPFASFLTDIFQQPRKAESWSLYTVRAGIAVKIGGTKKSNPAAPEVVTPVAVPEKQVQFSVRAPKMVPVNRRVKESFALRNSVFFNEGSTNIPDRYVQLSSGDANNFKEEQLQNAQPANLSQGRSSRQLAVYHNILNILGDRMRSNPGTSIMLTGASNKKPVEGKLFAENVKNYLVTAFGINGSRIETKGRSKPVNPSEQPGGTKELGLLREGDRRVDITSNSPELLLQVGGSTSPFLKPVQITGIQPDPLDSHVIFTVDGANELLNSWNVEVTDDKGNVQYYGPYTKSQASIAGKTILSNNTEGNYKIVMLGKTKSGYLVKKEETLRLVKADDTDQEGLRYSILFDFDQSKTLAAHEKFLTDVLTPLIKDNSTVIIHGHTDVIGDEKYNQSLSLDRAKAVQGIIEGALLKAGKTGVKFETFGFGEDSGISPFENNLPEERFYNRTVIIDI
ncbi:MAG: OmpA family protein, partial [Flavitalea sp.]